VRRGDSFTNGVILGEYRGEKIPAFAGMTVIKDIKILYGFEGEGDSGLDAGRGIGYDAFQ